MLLVVVDGMLEDGGGGGVPPLTPASGRSLDADGGGVLVLAYRLLVLQVMVTPQDLVFHAAQEVFRHGIQELRRCIGGRGGYPNSDGLGLESRRRI